MDLFSAGTAVCQSCGQTRTVPVPTFATATSWISPTWINLKQCIEHQCTPFPWISDPADVTWHDAACNRHETDVVDIQIGPWVYVSFRGNEMKHFPGYSTVTDILRDFFFSVAALLSTVAVKLLLEVKKRSTFSSPTEKTRNNTTTQTGKGELK